jgi:hypothetical protein
LDDYAAYLAEEAKSDVAALHQFRILYDNARKAYHFFFEGEEDSLFYMPEARRYSGVVPINVYVCGGKANVIRVRDEISAEGYNTDWTLYFVDRDYDDILNNQVSLDRSTYITDHYSIENDIATLDAARILLEDIIRLSRADPEFNRIEVSLATAYRRFYSEIRTLMGWIIAAKDSGCSPNLNNTVGLRDIVTMQGSVATVTGKGFTEFKRKVVVNGLTPNFTSVLRWARQLDMRSPKSWVRGKYDLWFFQVVVIAVLEETNVRRKAAGGRSVRIPSALREGRVFEMLGGRVSAPNSLKSFFANRLV